MTTQHSPDLRSSMLPHRLRIMKIVCYISGHGFGHLAQMAPVLNLIHHIRPDCQFFIRCALPKQEIQSRLKFHFELDFTPVDVGVVQKNAVEEDRQSSIEQMQIWIDQMDWQVEQEIELLRPFNPSLIISNISPLAFPVAKALGIAGIGLATLDWHTIYAHWLDPDDAMLKKLAEAYCQCDLLLTPPMAMDMQVFPKQHEIALISSQAVEIQSAIASNTPSKRALILFGGCGSPPYDLHALANMPDWLFLIPDAPEDAPNNVQSVQFDANHRPIDMMPFIDVVLCKPGYGVLSECWSTTTPIAWVERPDFPEFPMLKTWLNESFPACGMTRSDFQQGRWQHALDTAHNHSAHYPERDGDGAIDAANLILNHHLFTTEGAKE